MKRVSINLLRDPRRTEQEIAIIMPDDVAAEKEKALLALGAHVEKVRPASIVDKKQVRPDACASSHMTLRSIIPSLS